MTITANKSDVPTTAPRILIHALTGADARGSGGVDTGAECCAMG
jgi:hypothetical protein